MSAIDSQTFDLTGAHYALGYIQGERTAPFTVPTWWPPPPDSGFAHECAAILREVHALLLDEIEGYADAQSLSFDELLRGLCRRSMKARSAPTRDSRAIAALPSIATTATQGREHPYPEGGCSSFARVDANGHVRAGHNYDFYPMQRVRQRIRLAPNVGRPSVGMRGSVPGGRYDGVNDAGLFIALQVVLSDEPDEIRPGLPFHLIPRLALETCASAREAIELLTRVPHLNPFNYLVADSSGELGVVEAHPSRVRVRDPERSNSIAATNHFEHPDMRGFQRGRKLTHSHNRLRALNDGAALTDHTANLCGHAGGHTTLWSMQADLTARTVEFANGAPCEVAYESVQWPGV
ncbi:MAG: C45 family autoproteolytic acyltransferase/hydrolase [Anaerolineales bacterium]